MGRPALPKPIDKGIKGISPTPNASNSVIEFTCQYPAVLRGFCVYSNTVAVKHICMRFYEDAVEFYATDLSEAVHSCLRFEGSRAHHYYCEAPVTIYVSREELSAVLTPVSPDGSTVSIVLPRVVEHEEIIITKNGVSSRVDIKQRRFVDSEEEIIKDVTDEATVAYDFDRLMTKKSIYHQTRGYIVYRFSKNYNEPLVVRCAANGVLLSEVKLIDPKRMKEESRLGTNDRIDFNVWGHCVIACLNITLARVRMFIDIRRRTLTFKYEGDGYGMSFISPFQGC
jgi:hypothetical protein